MKEFITAMSIAAASVAIATGAVLGAAGMASAAPADASSHMTLGKETRSDHGYDDAARYDRSSRVERDDGRDDGRGYHANVVDRGYHHRTWTDDRDSCGDERARHHRLQHYWDGHRLVDGRRVEVARSCAWWVTAR
ncbi:hypothetical protein [Streptomyces cadmiisoli]|uniref:hypothetical protein n=1 Tax=Streptomyces cadmiisoli TaxID=2184053 RepID=UPI003D73A52D